MKVLILDPAEKELKEAVAYYNFIDLRLGRKFIESFEKTIDLIQKIPTGWEKISNKTRRINFKEFPFLVLYVIDKDTIIITFVCHGHRKSDYYKKHFH